MMAAKGSSKSLKMEGSGTSDEFVVLVGMDAPEDPDVAKVGIRSAP